MTPQQQYAYERPCYEAEETTNPNFYWIGFAPFGSVSVGLTANIGLE